MEAHVTAYADATMSWDSNDRQSTESQSKISNGCSTTLSKVDVEDVDVDVG